MAATTLAYAALAYHRRWIADDGMIAVRTVRQILAGNGPVYSPYERAETDTSTLWTLLLTLGGGLSGIDVARVADPRRPAVRRGRRRPRRCSRQPGSTRASARKPRQLLLPGRRAAACSASHPSGTTRPPAWRPAWRSCGWACAGWRWRPGGARSRRTRSGSTPVALVVGLAPLVRPEFVAPGSGLRRRGLAPHPPRQAAHGPAFRYGASPAADHRGLPRGLLRGAGPAPGAGEVRATVRSGTAAGAMSRKR